MSIRLFSEPHIRFEDDPVVWRALQAYRGAAWASEARLAKGGGFADALIVYNALRTASVAGEALDAVLHLRRGYATVSAHRIALKAIRRRSASANEPWTCSHSQPRRSECDPGASDPAEFPLAKRDDFAGGVYKVGTYPEAGKFAFFGSVFGPELERVSWCRASGRRMCSPKRGPRGSPYDNEPCLSG